MNYRLSMFENILQKINILFLIFLCIIMVYPLMHVLSISMSTPVEALRPGIHLFPLEVSLKAYEKAFSADGIWIGFKNTLFRTIVGTILSLLFMSMGAYPLSRKYLPHKYFYTFLITFTMFFSGGLIPTFFLVKALGLFDSIWALIVPNLINTFSMLILKNFFASIPAELEESAKIDGANDIRILFGIILPLSKPILATVALWMAVYNWNSWFDALIYTENRKNMVLQLLLRKLIVQNENAEMNMIVQSVSGASLPPETVKAAVVMIVTIPIIFVYPFLQKYYIKGILIGSIKG